MIRTIVSIHLFLNPSLEMDIKGVGYIAPGMLRQKGDELRERLYAAAEIVDKLQSDGWPMMPGSGVICDLEFVWEGNSKSAEKRLIELGIDPADVSVEEVENWD
jgi:hypothetical protein